MLRINSNSLHILESRQLKVGKTSILGWDGKGYRRICHLEGQRTVELVNGSELPEETNVKIASVFVSCHGDNNGKKEKASNPRH